MTSKTSLMRDFSLELNRLKVGILEHFRLDENEQRVEAANAYLHIMDV